MKTLLGEIAVRRPALEIPAREVFGPDIEDLWVRDDGTVALVDPASRAVTIDRHAAFDWLERGLRGCALAGYRSWHRRGTVSEPWWEPYEPEPWSGAQRYLAEFLARAAAGAPHLQTRDAA